MQSSLILTLLAVLAISGCSPVEREDQYRESDTGLNQSDKENDSSNTENDNSTETENKPSTQLTASMITAPLAGSIITERTTTLEFQNQGTMWLDIGSSVGGSDIFDQSINNAQQVTLQLPEHLTQLHAMLWTLIDGKWEKNTYQWPVNFTTENNETENATTTKSELSKPVANSIISDRTVEFEFQDKGSMWLYLGTSKGAKDILDEKISGSQFTSPLLPMQLSTLHVTLWTLINGTWQANHYQWQVNYLETDNTVALGKVIWEKNCSNSSCHSSGAVEGGLSNTSLANKKLFDISQLSQYIEQYMPLLNPASCDQTCARNVSAYIATWQTLPLANDDNDTTETTDGEPRNPVIAEQCSTETSIGYQSIRLLTRNQFQRSMEDLIGLNYDITTKLPVDLEAGSFTNNNQLNVLDSAYVGYLSIAEELAQWSAQRNFSGLLQCTSFNATCATQFIDNSAWKIIRRPFTSKEREIYLNLAKGNSTEGDVKTGIQLALNALLSSPQFLYRHEIGEPATAVGNNIYQLTQYELATYLSYAFSGTTPDSTLLDAAKNNQLVTPQQIEAQVSRLLDSASAQTLFEKLVHSWLHTDGILKQQKDSNLFANFNQVAPHMLTELSKTFSHIMLDENEKYESLYNADYTFLNEPLANHYKVGNVSGTRFQQTVNQERGGILLSGAFLSRWSHPEESNAITRAVHIRRDMLCQDIPNPPSDVSLSLKDKEGELSDFLANPTTTQRMRFHRTTEFGSCSTCHNEIINPLGFGLEDFNAVGIKRSQDANGNTINATGALWSPFLQLQFFDDPNRIQASVAFNGGKELGQVLATDPQVSGLAKSCLAKQMLSYVSGIDVRALSDSSREDVTQIGISENEKNGYTCDIMDLVDTLSNESPRHMLERMGSLESIRFRKAWSR